MVNPGSHPFRIYHGVLTLVPETEELSLIDSSGREMIIHETPRTRGLRSLLWDSVTLVGWLRYHKNRAILEVVDFSSQEEPPQLSELDDIDEALPFRPDRPIAVEYGFDAA